MSRYLLLRFDAPLMSFGGVVVDMHGVTMDFPGRSLLVGLFGNALGYDHGDALQLTELQQRLRHAVRQDRRGQPLADFQTASLGQPFLEAGWTTTGKAEARRGGSAKKGTHIRHRHYVTDAVFTIAVELVPPDDFPTLDELANALEKPARPLFLGRKACLPAAPLLLGFSHAASLKSALQTAALLPNRDEPASDPVNKLLAWWPYESDEHGQGTDFAVWDQRDWENGVHTGRRRMIAGTIHCGGNGNE